MAKIIAPLFSKIAKGAIARTLIFQNNGKTQTVKRWRAPRNTRSPTQLSRRATYRAAANSWAQLTPLEKQQWAIAAKPLHITGWNHYLSTYLLGHPPTSTTTWDAGATIWDAGATTWDNP